MRQSRTAGWVPDSARRLALTSLGAGLAVAAAAPMASAATVPEAAPAASSGVAQAGVLGSTAANADSVPVTAAQTAPQNADAVIDSAAAPAMNAPEAAPPPAWSRLGQLKLYPLAGTGIDPLSNVVDTNLGGIPISTQPVTDTVSGGLPVSQLPVVGALFGAGSHD